MSNSCKNEIRQDESFVFFEISDYVNLVAILSHRSSVRELNRLGASLSCSGDSSPPLKYITSEIPRSQITSVSKIRFYEVLAFG